MKKGLLSSFMVFCLVMTISVNVFADPISDAKNNLQNQQSQYNSIGEDINSNQGDIDKLEQTVQKINNQISALNSRISHANNKIKVKEKAINDSQKEINKVVKEIDKQQSLLNERVRVMYINGDNSYLSFVLDSNNFSDLISRMDIVRKIVNFDKGTIQTLNDSRKQVEVQKKALEKEKTDLVEIKSDLEKNKAEIAVKQKAQQQALNSLNATKASLNTERAKYASQINSAKAKIAALIKAEEAKKNPSNSSPSRGYTSGSASGIVAFAGKYIGSPYVWGAEGQVVTRSLLNWARAQGHYSSFQEQFLGKAQGFDCSGLVQYVYAHFGINLPRTTYYQVNAGQTVSKNNLKAGDLIFYGSSGNVYHVGIYIGDGLIIEAPYTGATVRISPAFRSNYYTARRVM